MSMSRKTSMVAALLVLMCAVLSVPAYAAVGATQGTFEVNRLGAATYRIPIWAPKGPGKLTPSIALQYNSQAGNGNLGIGWVLAGLNKITRCNLSAKQDGYSGSPNLYDGASPFCFQDGTRLRWSGGPNYTGGDPTPGYGAVGSIYYTEIANFGRITIKSNSVVTGYFSVEGKDGLIYEYGSTADSQALYFQSYPVMEWLLNKISDRDGNSIIITYANNGFTSYHDSGATYSGVSTGTVPHTIQWGPTVSGGSSYQYQMTFNYQQKNNKDAVFHGMAGLWYYDTNLLTSISIGYSASGVGYNTVRQYQLAYSASPTTQQSLLTQVTECAATTTDCLAPTKFTYQKSGGVSTATATASAGSSLQLSKYDVNGDGRSDLVFVSGGTWKVAFSNGSGFNTPVDTGISSSISPWIDRFLPSQKYGFLIPLNGVWNYVGYSGTTFVTTSVGVSVTGSSIITTDNNGDGLADLAWIDKSNNLIVKLNTTTGAATYPSFSTSSSVAYAFGTQPTPPTVFGHNRCLGTHHCDLNGDGADDLGAITISLSCWAQGCTASASYSNLISNGTGGYTTGNGISITNNSAPASFTGINFNNDKCIDLLQATTLTVSGCSDGSGATVTVPATPIAVMDWDGDGKTDVLVNNNGTIGVYLSTGNTNSPFSALKTTTIPYRSSCNYFVMDIDGDGLDDLVCSQYASPYSISYYTHAGGIGSAGTSVTYYGVSYLLNTVPQQPDLLASITDGFGVKIMPTYVSTSQTDIALSKSSYTAGSNTQAPLQDIQDPLIVTGLVTYQDASNNYSKVYTYSGLRKDTTRLTNTTSFQTISVLDTRNGFEEKTTYTQTFPNVGMVSNIDVYQSDLVTPISRVQQTNTSTTSGSVLLSNAVFDDRYFPYTQSSTIEKYEVGGNKNGMLISTATTTDTYDGYGNITNETTTTVDNDTIAPASPTQNQSWTTSIANSTSPDTRNWCLDLITKSVTANSSTVSNSTPVSVTTSYTADAAHCRVKEKIVAPSTPYQVTTDYGYDDDAGDPQPDFGNVTSVTVTGTNMQPRKTTLTWNAQGQFPLTITSPLLQSVQSTYYPDTGALKTQTDANNLATTWYYDTFVRKNRELKPDGTDTIFNINPCSSSSCPNDSDLRYWIQEIHRDATTSHNKLRETDAVYNDHRQMRYVMDQTLDGSFIYKAHRTYDVFGRIERDYVPGTSVASSFHGYQLDALGRVIDDGLYDASGSLISKTLITYAGNTTTTTDANQKNSVKAVDPLGRVTLITDHNGYSESFTYDSYGSLTKVTDNQSNTLLSATYGYGASAFVTSKTDIDSGKWTFTPDALGEVLNYTDAKGQGSSAHTASFTYDLLSRPTQRIESDMTTWWTYGKDSTLHNIGRVQNVCVGSGTGTTCTSPTYQEAYSFDSVGRLNDLQITSDATYNYDSTYNATTGLLDTVTYPTSTSGYRLQLKYAYQHGILQSVSDATNSSTVYWKANAVNAFGEITQETLGNGLATNRAYDPSTGWLQSIQSAVGGATAVQNESYLFDAVGNLLQRQNNTPQGLLTENFYYDNVYRLDHSTLQSSSGTANNLQMAYDAMGNITSRSDVGSYDYTTPQSGCAYYANSQRHAVRKAGSVSYCYDANGNMIGVNGNTNAISWFSFNQPKQINANGNTTSFSYDDNHQRWKQVATYGGATETTVYIGSAMEKVTHSVNGVTTTDYKHYINAGGAVVLYVRRDNNTNNTYYLTKDHLSSTDLITCGADVSGCAQGSALVKESFSAFGLRRSGTDWKSTPSTADMTNIAATTRQGFTGQEMMDNLSLINMNGRIYNPVMGRFINPDPHVTDPSNTQNYNRYSYALNNPLRYTDPTGKDVGDDFCDACVSDPGSDPGSDNVSDPSTTDPGTTDPSASDSNSSGDQTPNSDALTDWWTPVDADSNGTVVYWHFSVAGVTQGDDGLEEVLIVGSKISANLFASDLPPSDMLPPISSNFQGGPIFVGPVSRTVSSVTLADGLQAGGIALTYTGTAADRLAGSFKRSLTNIGETIYYRGAAGQFNAFIKVDQAAAVSRTFLRVIGKAAGIVGASVDTINTGINLAKGDKYAAKHAAFNAVVGWLAVGGAVVCPECAVAYFVLDASLQVIGLKEGVWDLFNEHE